MPNPTLLETDDDDVVTPKGPTFKIFSGALKAFEKEVDGQNRRYLSCTASSTVKDLHGDVMTDDCVMGMAPQAKAKGMTIFLNHSYQWPEDVFGKTTDARIVSRSSDSDGRPIYDLDLEIQLNESNQRALDSYTAIKEQGIKAGVSIGAMIEDWDYLDEEQGFWGGLEIKRVDLLEASVVGIPANQRSWVVNALKALGAPNMVVRKALGMNVKAPTISGTVSNGLVLTNGVEFGSGQSSDNVDIHVQTAEEVVDPITDVEDSAAPSTEIPDETEDTSTEDSDEATEKESPAPDAVAEVKAAGLDEGLTEILLGFLEGAAEEVASLRKTNESLVEDNADLTRQLGEAAEIVEAIARTPLGRKATFAAPVASFRQKFGGIYDEHFLKLLEEGDEN